MQELQLANGVTLAHPDNVKASEAKPRRRPRGQARTGTRSARGRSSEPLDTLDPLIAALAAQGMELVGQFELSPKPARRSRGGTRSARSGLPGSEGPSSVEIDLGTNEDAVVLTVDTNDEVDWVLPSGESLTGGTRSARGARPRRGRRRVTFTIETSVAVPQPKRRGTRQARGLKEMLARGVLGYVFRFVRSRITKRLIDHLEKGVTPGLVRVSSNVSAEWSPLGPKGVLPQRAAKAADGIPRVLLLVHGTFSSTIGSYGGLSFSEEGLALLNGVQQHYDHVIGWDHRTLSEEPLPNAKQIREGLDRLFGAGGAIVDAVGYSRGGLVLRAFLEQVAPGTKWEGRVKQAIFVGCTLNGTKLAQVKNWKAFVKIYTNLAIAACRGVRVALPPAAIATVWVETVARGISVLVRFLASAVLDGDGIPGLTAMDPDKDVVKTLNAQSPSDAVTATYRAITNDFEPGLSDAGGVVLPASFKMRAADLIMDAQMREPNDLVVNTSSMRRVGLADLPAEQVHALPRNGRTIHTTYFRDVSVITQLRSWLLGDRETRAARGVRSRVTRRSAKKGPAAGRNTAARRATKKRGSAKPAPTPRAAAKRTTRRSRRT